MRNTKVYHIQATVGKLTLANKETKRILHIKSLMDCTTRKQVNPKEIKTFVDVCLKGRVPLPATIKTEKVKTKKFVGKRIVGFIYDNQLEVFEVFKNYLVFNGLLQENE